MYLLFPLYFIGMKFKIRLFFNLKECGQHITHHVIEVPRCMLLFCFLFASSHHTLDIANFVPQTNFECYPNKYFDYCYALGNGKYQRQN